MLVITKLLFSYPPVSSYRTGVCYMLTDLWPSLSLLCLWGLQLNHFQHCWHKFLPRPIRTARSDGTEALSQLTPLLFRSRPRKTFGSTVIFWRDAEKSWFYIYIYRCSSVGAWCQRFTASPWGSHIFQSSRAGVTITFDHYQHHSVGVICLRITVRILWFDFVLHFFSGVDWISSFGTLQSPFDALQKSGHVNKVLPDGRL